jgi:hypothetical protein
LNVELSGVVVEVRRVGRSAERGQRDLLASVAAPQPRLVRPQRSAGFHAVILDAGAGALASLEADVVHRGVREALVFRFLRDVVRLQLSRGDEVPRGSVRLVRAALRDEVQGDARNRDRRIGAARRDLDLLELVEVVVRRRRAERRHVRDRDAIHVERVLSAVSPHSDEDRLLSALVAGHIQPVHLDAGHLVHDRPGIAARRDVLQLGQLKIRAALRLSRVENRRFPRDRDGRRDRRDLEGHRDIRVLPEADDDPLPVHGREALQRDAHVVGADRQVQEVKLSA